MMAVMVVTTVVEGALVIIVTDAPHLPRALMVARRLGLEARGSAPRGGARIATQTRMALREIPACAAYLWRLRRL